MTACVIRQNMIVEDECEEEPNNVDSTQPSIAEKMEDDDVEDSSSSSLNIRRSKIERQTLNFGMH